jgi:hypothetical protein
MSRSQAPEGPVLGARAPKRLLDAFLLDRGKG